MDESIDSPSGYQDLIDDYWNTEETTVYTTEPTVVVAQEQTPVNYQVPTSEVTSTTPTDVNIDSAIITENSWLPLDMFLAQSYFICYSGEALPVMRENEALLLEAGGLVRLMLLYSVLTDPDYAPSTPLSLTEFYCETEPFASGETISTETALFAMFYEASDEATKALIDHYGPGREAMLQKMQEHASELGMSNTSYTDPSGMTRGSMTTAEDTTKLVLALNELSAFRIMVEKQMYLLPQGAQRSVSGLSGFSNPAAYVKEMSSPYLQNLNGIMLTDSSDGWSYGVAEAVSNDGRHLLAVVMGAATRLDEIQGEQRAAQVLRTLLEEGAKELGVESSSGWLLERTQPTPTTVEEFVPEATTDESLAVSTPSETQIVPTETTSEVIVDETSQDQMHFGNNWAFYAMFGCLLLAIIGLLIYSIASNKKRSD